MDNSFVVIPYLKVHPNKIVMYSRVEYKNKRRRNPTFTHLLSSDKKHNGQVSIHARRKISTAVNYLLFMANDKLLPNSAHGKNYSFKLAFITLTLPSPQIHPDPVIKSKCLNQFLIELTKRYHVKNYIWRAEKQKNGNIHFHILVDKFIPWSELRDRWNRIIEKLNYVTNYRADMENFHRDGFKFRPDLQKFWSMENQIKAYQTGKRNDWNNPNSTDVHSLKRVNQVQAYILKYIAKPEANEIISGLMWSCNENLSNIRGAVEIADSSFKNEVSSLKNADSSNLYIGEYFSVLEYDFSKINAVTHPGLYKLFCQYLLERFNFNIQSQF